MEERRKWRRGQREGCLVLSKHASAFVTGKPFLLEWGGEQPDLGHKNDLPWAIVLRMLPQGEAQLARVPPEKAHKVGVHGRMGHLCGMDGRDQDCLLDQTLSPYSKENA